MKFSPAFALIAFLPSTLAHFVLQYPTSLGFDDGAESEGPCGGFSVPEPLTSNVNSTNVTVDQFAIALQTTHPQAQFLYRVSLTGSNFTNILPVVSEVSIGEFCLPNLKVPDSYANQKGVIQVIQNGPDGILYQCAIVNFVSGANTTVGPACTNATGLTASVTTESNFTNTSSTSASASATSSHSAATTLMQTGGLMGVAFAVLSAVFMI